MHYEFSRKTVVILVITIIAGFVVYNIAPTEIEPGQYSLTLEIHSDSIDASHTYNVSFVVETTGNDMEHRVNGTATNVTVTIPQSVEITPNNPLRVTIDVVGEDLVPDLRADLASPIAIAQCDRDASLRGTLADDVAVQLTDDLFGRQFLDAVHARSFGGPPRSEGLDLNCVVREHTDLGRDAQ